MYLKSVQTGVNFKGITPIRVYRDGEEVLDGRIIRNTCSKLVQGLAGPLDSKFKPAAAQLAVRDPDYSYSKAFFGYTTGREGTVPSDFIKVIYDKNNRGYFVTGDICNKLSELGYLIGRAKKECNKAGQQMSLNLEIAQKNYHEFVKRIGSSMNLRTRATFNPISKEKLGAYQVIDINISTKPHKHKNEICHKVFINDIEFSDSI